MSNETTNGLLGGSAPPVTLTLGGRQLAGRLDQRTKGLWERYLRRRAFAEAVETTGDQLAAARVASSMGALGAFGWTSLFSREMLVSPAGGLAFAALVFGCTEADVETLAREQPGQLKDALEQLVAESSEGKGAADPNPPSGAPS